MNSNLGTWHKGQRGRIVSFNPTTATSETPFQNPLYRLIELGCVEGAEIEVVHEAPFGKDPIAIRVRDTLIAINRQEASWIQVEETL